MIGSNTWIIAIHNSEADGTDIQRVYGTKDQVKQYLADLVKRDRENCDNLDDWEYGTEGANEVGKCYCGAPDELYAYGCYFDHYIDYTAIPEKAPLVL